MKKEIKISNNNMKDSTSTAVYKNELNNNELKCVYCGGFVITNMKDIISTVVYNNELKCAFCKPVLCPSCGGFIITDQQRQIIQWLIATNCWIMQRT